MVGTSGNLTAERKTKTANSRKQWVEEENSVHKYGVLRLGLGFGAIRSNSRYSISAADVEGQNDFGVRHRDFAQPASEILFVFDG